MDKIRIKQNYGNYERVTEAFKNFIHALVWESMDIDAGVHEGDVTEYITQYCNTYCNQMISLANNSVSKFIKSLESRYEVHCYEINDNGDAIEDTAKHYNTDNIKTALNLGASFYRQAKCPQVNIFDNVIGEYIAEWD